MRDASRRGCRCLPGARTVRAAAILFAAACCAAALPGCERNDNEPIEQLDERLDDAAERVGEAADTAHEEHEELTTPPY